MSEVEVRAVAGGRGWPESTYRLQFHGGFGFREAAGVVGYLHALGVTDVYCSPYLKARAGSAHGYDVVDHNALNPELGTAEDYEAFVGALAGWGMSQVLDTVPNHVGVGTNENVWWNDVLEFGPGSKYAGNFDIEWDAPWPELKGKVLLPVLGKRLEEAIADGEIGVVKEGGKWWVAYYERRFPVNPGTYGLVGGPIERLLDAQFYRLDYWRTASSRINYRRFFDINDLAGIAMEKEEVFECAHALTMRLVGEGKVMGLRVDHPDGLYDPKRYFERLQGAARWRPLYVVAEKILGAGEELPGDWAVNGTTGYDFLGRVNGLYVAGEAEGAMTRVYEKFTGERVEFEALAYEKKLMILEASFGGELEMLAVRLARLAGGRFSLEALRRGLGEVIAAFPVYRTYITAEGGVSESDRRWIGAAIERARGRNPEGDGAVYALVRETLELSAGDGEGRAEQARFAGKFQQLTAPVMAKGVEDTAFYLYNRLVSLNEVGGDPGRFGVGSEALHAYFSERQRRWPYALSALSTHDTKRSEDVRARINVLAEIAEEWGARVGRWRELNRGYKTEVGGRVGPDGNEEYLFYQTIVGAWPLGARVADEGFIGRIRAYMEKAIREAKAHTRWTEPDAGYEAAVRGFVEGVLRNEVFLGDFVPFAGRVAEWGMVNSLSQTVLKLTGPGVADTYQGTEVWDFSLVDPDNRRAVDYGLRRRLLEEIEAQRGRAGFIEEMMGNWRDGRVKLFVTATLLRLRRENPGLFTEGEYEAAVASGSGAGSVFGFARQHGGQTALVVVPRLVTRVEAGWGDTRVGFGGVRGWFRNVLTGEGVEVEGGGVEVGRLLGGMAVGVLSSE